MENAYELVVPTLGKLAIESSGKTPAADAGGAGQTEFIDADGSIVEGGREVTRTSVRTARKRGTGEMFAKQMAARVLERASNAAVAAQALSTGLDLWSDELRGVPNHLVRSGLFSAMNTDKREFLRGQQIHALSNYKIIYTGEALQQDDLSIWIALVNMVRDQSLEDKLSFTAYALINDLGWRMHTETYQRIKASIERMKVTSLKLEVKGENGFTLSYAGSLIREYAFSESDDTTAAGWAVRFEPQIARLFHNQTTTLIEWSIRKKIGSRARLALWLHAYFATHERPLPISVPKVHELCMSGDRLSSFRRNIRLALDRLVSVGYLERFSVVNDVITVSKAKRSAALIEGRSKDLALEC